jgi:hypothetical protein
VHLPVHRAIFSGDVTGEITPEHDGDWEENIEVGKKSVLLRLEKCGVGRKDS